MRSRPGQMLATTVLVLASIAAIAATSGGTTPYHPPFSVDFGNISASDFQSQTFVLHGVSEDTTHNARYETTCSLTVQRRLDHLPTDKERKEWARAPAPGGAAKP
jgi:hypothetical protein